MSFTVSNENRIIEMPMVDYVISLIFSLTKEELIEALETFERDYAEYLKENGA